MHEVFWELDLEIGRVGELEHMVVAGELEVNDLVALWARIWALEYLETAMLAVEVNRRLEVGDAYASVEELDHSLTFIGIGLAKAKPGYSKATVYVRL